MAGRGGMSQDHFYRALDRAERRRFFERMESMDNLTPMQKMEARCTEHRNAIRDLGELVRSLMVGECYNGEELFMGQHAEMKANVMLAVRHLEDARMRVGEVMQQIQGGVSIFDRQEQERRTSVDS